MKGERLSTSVKKNEQQPAASAVNQVTYLNRNLKPGKSSTYATDAKKITPGGISKPPGVGNARDHVQQNASGFDLDKMRK